MPRVVKWLGDALEGLMGSKFPLMQVIAVEHINPHLKRIRLQGNIAEMDFQLGYAVAIRVSETEYRNYTISFSDVHQGILEIIFHLHGKGPGSHFMNRLVPGESIRISIPRGKKMYDSSTRNYILFGDETALGLASAFQNKADEKGLAIHFYFELDKENENIPHLIGLKDYTVFPKPTFFQHEDLIDELPLFKTDDWRENNFILVGNAKSVQSVRNSLRKKQIKGKILAQAYWAEGKTGL